MAEDIRNVDVKETEELFSNLAKARKKDNREEAEKIKEIENLTRNIWAGDGLRKIKKK